MTFIPVSTQLVHAVQTSNTYKVEELISNSDSKRELILEHISINGKESLESHLKYFRSKGLIQNIKVLLDIE